jgi:molybdenum cofactor guanylyltransferase
VILKTKSCLFHPLELSICGHSGSGKSTLIQKLIKKFSSNLNVGYIKHDAHKFEMDKDGKDTYMAREAGASNIAISSSQKSALILNDQNERILFAQNFIDSDVVFIEGYKDSLCHKVLMWTGSVDDHNLLKKYLSEDKQQLLAIVGTDLSGPVESIPYFNRNNIQDIYDFITGFWENIISSRPIYGLILGGGHSTRMGQDKSQIIYHGKSQVDHLYELLEKMTEKTYLSCREEQTNSTEVKGIATIKDRFVDFGPTGGILSAFNKHPNAAWLVLACDMPFINAQVINDLLKKRNPYRVATCFYNEERKWPEPLCAIYEPKAALKLGQYLALGKPCPRKVLMNSHIESLKPISQSFLGNVNTPGEFQEAYTQIQKESELYED